MDAEVSFKDRSFGLMFFGAYQIMLGLGSVCMVPLAILGMWMGQQQSGGIPMSVYTIASVIINYGGIGIALCVLGAGSWRARRWAQRLGLALGITWLACGIGGMIAWLAMLPVFPDYMRAVSAAYPAGAMPDSMITVSMIAGSIFIGILYVLLPLPIVIFYAGRNVAATCKWYDPTPRWTDRLPIPVLMAVIVWGATGLFMLAFLAGPLPALGRVLTPPAASVLALVLTGAFFALAYGLTTLRMRWWWFMVALAALGTVNGV
ncbi:MAG: hypothetical protein IT368_13710 [Candidatus Hydrogenedentes bacterium]|nr:hypothetical protein [Candidatus Hydrogenedentota bacterium]